VESDKLTEEERQQKERVPTQAEQQRYWVKNRALAEEQCRNSTRTRTTGRSSARWKNCQNRELTRKIVIYSQNPEPYSFLKLPLFTDGSFNSQLPTFENIHY
jgi:hypothetical protein